MKGRIAFFSPRHFGQLGTPGTFRVIEEVAQYHAVRIFAQAPSDNSVYWRQDVPLIPLVGALSERVIAPVLPALREFCPDIIYIFNAPRWPETIDRLRKEFPFCKFIFDIKTPLLVNDENQKIAIKQSGDRVLELVDCVVTHAKESVDTWFSRCHHEPVLLPPGIDISNFSGPHAGPDVEFKAGQRPLQWVYAASLHKMRRGGSLIQAFKIFLDHHSNAAVLHIYGGGADRAVLEKQVGDSGLSGSILFHGLVPQQELFRAMAKMDGAIGWVPRQLYDKSPSLKVLEYAAAGLPILATATTAHREMEHDGFTLDFCEDTPESLAEGLSRWVANGFGEERVRQNRRAAETRDYSRLVCERLLPVFDDLLGASKEAGTYQLRSKVTSDVSRIGDNSTKVPLRILITLNACGENSGKVTQAVDLAVVMASQGHCVYLAYRRSQALATRPDDSVVLFPYKNSQSLRTLIEGGRFDVMAAYTANHDELLLLAWLSNRNCLPLVIQNGATTKCESSEESSENVKSRARACWEHNLILGLKTTFCLPSSLSLTPSQAGKEIEVFLDKQAKSLYFEDDFLNYECENDYERALHQRRMQRKVLGE